MTLLEIQVKKNMRASKIIERHCNGDKRAFGELMELHSVELLAYIYNMMHNREDAKDAMQGVFVILFESLRDGLYVENQMFGGWLKKTAKFHVLKIKRGEKTFIVVTDVLPEVVVDLFENSDYLNERLELLKRAKGKLTEKDIVILNLRFEDGKAWVEIDEVLGMSTGSASRQCLRVLDKLRKNMGGSKMGWADFRN